jgi:hypothetical protein
VGFCLVVGGCKKAGEEGFTGRGTKLFQTDRYFILVNIF